MVNINSLCIIYVTGHLRNEENVYVVLLSEHQILVAFDVFMFIIVQNIHLIPII